MPDTVEKEQQNVGELVKLSKPTRSVGKRLKTWQAALAVFLAGPLFGWGGHAGWTKFWSQKADAATVQTLEAEQVKPLTKRVYDIEVRLAVMQQQQVDQLGELKHTTAVVDALAEHQGIVVPTPEPAAHPTRTVAPVATPAPSEAP